MSEKILWDKFNLAEKNPDQGGGILYCLRYTYERIRGHQESIVTALESIGIELVEIDEGIGVKSTLALNESEQNRVYALLEELSCLNEALEYAEAGLNQYNSIGQLGNGLMNTYIELLKENKKPDAYNFITMMMYPIIRDLRTANNQNGVLSASERRELTDLIEFTKGQYDLLNRPKEYIVLGLKYD